MGTRHLYWILSALHLQCTKVQGLELMVHVFRVSTQERIPVERGLYSVLFSNQLLAGTD
jgi:hypothetical protein